MLGMLMAACSQERLDLVEAPSATGAQRPVAENVTLSFGKGVDTRVYFDGTFHWDDGDVVGAMLMDEIYGDQLPQTDAKDWAQLSWLERYQLVNYTHTAYPFKYDKAETTWSSAAKMLEGNYFFAYPYENCFGGNRQLLYSLGGQTQKDGTQGAMAEAFGKNQFWVGYAQIKAGNEEFRDVLNVDMNRVLAPITFEIKNVGTTDFHVTKVTVQGADVHTTLTIDPTEANYKGKNGIGKYNLKDEKTFNYANYLGLEDELYVNATGVTNTNLVNNIDDSSNYDKAGAIRKVANWIDNPALEQEYAELTFENVQLAKHSKGNIIYGVIYVNPDEKVEDLKMNIYTEEGLIKNIDLTVVNTEIKQGVNSAITDGKISVLDPNEMNHIRIDIDNNSVDPTDNVFVNNTNDLLQFIQWNANMNRTYIATLKNDATLTDEMVDILVAARKSYAKNQLVIKSADKVLTIAEGVAKNVFEYVDARGVEVLIEGEVLINTDEDVNVSGETTLPVTKVLTVAEGATLELKKVKVKVADKLHVINNGTLNVTGASENVFFHNTNEMTVSATLSAVNSNMIVYDGESSKASRNTEGAVLTVTKDGVLKGQSTRNEGKIYNYGEIWNVKNNKKGYVLAGGSVNHFDENTTNATIELTSIETPGLTVTDQSGKIFFSTDTAILMSKVEAATVTDLELKANATLNVDGSTSATTVKSINVIGNTTIQGWNTTTSKPVQQNLYAATDGKITVDGCKLTMLGISSKSNFALDVINDGTLEITSATGATSVAVKNVMLGNKERFDEFGATIVVNANATLSTNSIERASNITVKPTIKNNGTIKALLTKTNFNYSGNDPE